MDYEKDMIIDETALDIEWLDQAQLALRYGRHWAECQEELTRAEEEIKLIRSELIKEANDDPDKCLGAGVKPTGPNVEAYYRTHKRHKDAKEAWVKAQFECNVASIAKWEVSNTRKAALENLVRLHGQEYFAGPSIPRDLTEQREHQQKKVDKGIKDKLKSKRTK